MCARENLYVHKCLRVEIAIVYEDLCVRVYECV